MNKLFSSQLSRKIYRYTVQWPIAILRELNFNRYHKQYAVLISACVLVSGLSAIEHHGDGSWGMPIILFNIAVLAFIFGSSELMFVIDQRYKGLKAKCEAISRSISYYGIAATIILICELYSYTVKFGYW